MGRLRDFLPQLHWQFALATKLIFHKIHAALGGHLRTGSSGAAPMIPSVAKFFHAAGILILEGIGMTANISFSNVNRHGNYCFGRVGQPAGH